VPKKKANPPTKKKKKKQKPITNLPGAQSKRHYIWPSKEGKERGISFFLIDFTAEGGRAVGEEP